VSFWAAALTRQRDIQHSSYFDLHKDKVVILAVKDIHQVKELVEYTVMENKADYGQTGYRVMKLLIAQHHEIRGQAVTSNPTCSVKRIFIELLLMPLEKRKSKLRQQVIISMEAQSGKLAVLPSATRV
jgi:hypothetical protein